MDSMSSVGIADAFLHWLRVDGIFNSIFAATQLKLMGPFAGTGDPVSGSLMADVRMDVNRFWAACLSMLCGDSIPSME